jgi:exopolysaccharide biosynthesis polyprenyl glycosylphosphotransferase
MARMHELQGGAGDDRGTLPMSHRRVQGRRRGRDPSRTAIAVCGRAIVVWLAVAVIASAQHPQGRAGLVSITIAAGIWLVSLRILAAGAPYALGPWVPAGMGAAAGLVCVAALNPYLPGLDMPPPALLATGLGVFLSSGTWDAVLERTARRRVLVIGTTAVVDVAAAANVNPRLPFEIFGADPGAELPDVALRELVAVVEAQQPDVIVLTDDASCSAALERLLDMTDRRFRVAGLTSFYEYAFGWLPLQHLTPMWFLSLLHLRQRPGHRPSKRLFDVTLALIGLLLTAPLLPLIALLVKWTPGPLIYRQVRVGEGGRRFTMYKFRSMPVTAERPGEAVFAQDSDPRASGPGRFLRKTHLDELPQLWNVLKGDMSIVGPRPERPQMIVSLEAEIPFWSRRLLMKPGMTGWAQVRSGYGRDGATHSQKLSYDFWYMRHGSLAVDIAVCIETVLQVLRIFSPRRLVLRRGPRSEPVA